MSFVNAKRETCQFQTFECIVNFNWTVCIVLDRNPVLIHSSVYRKKKRKLSEVVCFVFMVTTILNKSENSNNNKL